MSSKLYVLQHMPCLRVSGVPSATGQVLYTSILSQILLPRNITAVPKFHEQAGRA